MAQEIAISLKNISKCFKRYIHPVERLKEILVPGKTRANDFWALQDINLEVFQGETLGILGQNGSGKSTLLQIIAGTLMPTTGEVQINGRVSALLELGCGFSPEFTGRQNVFFNGQILGLSVEEIEAKFDDIAAFAEIGDFINQPVKTYSTGMVVRLAFAVVANTEPRTLIIDEALAVGDARFQARCMKRIRQLKEQGVTILFVSHDSGSVKMLCQRAALMNYGRMIEIGDPKEVVNHYIAILSSDSTEITNIVTPSTSTDSTSNGQAIIHQEVTEITDIVATPSADSTSNGQAIIHQEVTEITDIVATPSADSTNNGQVTYHQEVTEITDIVATPSADSTNNGQVTYHQEVTEITDIVATPVPEPCSSNGQLIHNDNSNKSVDTHINKDPFLYRHGNKLAIISNVNLINLNNKQTTKIETGELFKIEIIVEAKVDLSDLIVGISLRNLMGLVIYGTNTRLMDFDLPSLTQGESLVITFHIPCYFNRGVYTLTVGLHSEEGVSYDWIDELVVFEVNNSKQCDGFVDLNAKIEINQLSYNT